MGRQPVGLGHRIQKAMTGLAQQVSAIVEKATELEALLDSARERVLRRTRDFEAAAEPAIGKPEAAKILGCSVSTLERRLADKNPPPHYKDGGKVTFYASELRHYKSAYRVGKIENHSSAT